MEQSLTDISIKALKAGAKNYDTPDPSMAGLFLRVSPKGKKSWFYRYKDPALVVNKLGEYPAISLAEARSRWHTLKDTWKRTGVSPKAQKAEILAESKTKQAELDKDQDTIERLKDQFLDSIKTLKSHNNYQYMLELALKPHYDVRAIDFKRGDVLAVLNPYREKGQHGMSNSVHSAIRKLFNWAIENEKMGIEYNPCSVIRMMRNNVRTRHLSDAELRRVLKVMAGMERYAPPLMMALLTGCRIGEACQMRYSDILEGEWNIPANMTKNGYPHSIYLSPQALSFIPEKSFFAQTDYVFPALTSAKKHTLPNSVSKKVREMDWGIDKFTPHDFRRTLATWLGEREVDENIHDRMLNHVVGGIRKVYNVAKYNRPAREWWLKWGQHIASLQADNVVMLEVKSSF